MTKRLNIRVTGRVQGVFFRATARDVADALGVKGFVRNERDGSVYMEAEGDPEILERFLAWCREGPPRAVVSNVEVVDGTAGGFTAFEIRRF